MLLGPPGTGKTHLTTGLAIRACQAGHGSCSPPRPSESTGSPKHTTRG